MDHTEPAILESRFRQSTGAREAAVVTGVVLLIVYVFSLAPTVTYWDAGEFLAAIKALGIPHPPGTPLFILIGNVWAKILSPVMPFAQSVNLLSAVCTAVACGALAWLFAKWTDDSIVAICGGVIAGAMSSVWLNANETEVYSPSLLVSILLMVIAYRADETQEERWLVLLAFLAGLGWSLQLSALVAAPAALFLAFRNFRGRKIPWTRMMVVALLGASATLFMIVRARHDPAVNQGNPSTWSALADVITRKQYLPVPMFPRQAPWYIQIGNLFEYADWQVALGLHSDPPPTFARTSVTVLYVLLGIAGSVWHRRTNRRSWEVMMLLFVTATLGVVVYLNMKASPSYGHGFLPETAKHEARERDYFFALGFACWGMWAGAGAIRLMRRVAPRYANAGLAFAVIPIVLNFSAVSRARYPEALYPIQNARLILDSAPERAVVFAHGDNDTYPVWYAQQVEDHRPDVTNVTIPLLGATWYRAELRRRFQLLDSGFVVKWYGAVPTISDLCSRAHQLKRPVVIKIGPGLAAIPGECQ